MITPRMKYVILYYRKGSNAVDELGQPEFSQVFICPTLELRHNTPADVAQELIERTLGPEWRWQLRRAITAGDMFTMDTKIYAFVEPDSPEVDIKISLLNNWKHLAIAELGPESCMELTSTIPSSYL